MSDLTALVPNLEVPCFVVAPAAKLSNVEYQVNRPTFAMRERPVASYCRFISFETLIEEEGRSNVWRHQRFSYLADELSDSLELDRG